MTAHAPDSSRNRTGTQDRFLRSALELFASQGYDATSVQNIAKAADANVSLISRYFGGKEGLLFAIVEQAVATKSRAPLGYPPQETLRSEILEYLRFRLEEDNRQKDLVKVLLGQLLTSDRFRSRVHKILGSQTDENFLLRLETLRRKHRTFLSNDELFAVISMFSFSANVISHQLLKRPKRELDKLFSRFAEMVDMSEHR